jgi:DNA-directed RNA polymerase subunit M/transcription elongation factor TFIIS
MAGETWSCHNELPFAESRVEMFCPYCANLLLVEAAPEGMHFACKVSRPPNPIQSPINCNWFFGKQTCPYDYKVSKKLKKDVPLEQKRVLTLSLEISQILAESSLLEQVDDVLGDTFKNAPVTDVLGGCPKCGNVI